MAKKDKLKGFSNFLNNPVDFTLVITVLMLLSLGLVMVLIWGNSPALCEIFPIVSGAIGGAVAGGMGVVSIYLMKTTKKFLYKILIGLGVFVATLLICFVIAELILSAA